MNNIENQGLIPWSTVTTQEWLDTVESWAWEQDGGVWRKSGICINCGHNISKELFEGFGLVDIADVKIDIKCNCIESHPGRPEGVTQGCGFAGVGFSPPTFEPE